ncbi:hypothetical protein JD969_04710 [Planctomycetota bacterium]|nr:hypothetical protein JD969_04710 [Planctomycetota bacterium]
MLKSLSKQQLKCYILLALTLGAVILFIAALILLSLQWPHPQPTDINASLLWPYWITYAILFLLLSLTVYHWRSFDPKYVSTRTAFWLILIVAILARIVVVLATQPTLSDDIWRYIHDGATFASGTNPYKTAPADIPDNQSASPPEVLHRINHPKLQTIYLPVSQYIFALISFFKVQTWDALGDKTFRLAFVLFDIGIIILMLKYLAKHTNSPPLKFVNPTLHPKQNHRIWYAILYAWHPLPISEIAGSGHQDVLGILPLLGAMILYQSTKKSYTRIYLTGKLFAISLAVKPIMLPIFLPMVWWLRKEKKRMFALILSTTKILIIIFIPFFFLSGSIDGLLKTSDIFVHQWAGNGSIYPYILDIYEGYKNPTILTIGCILFVIIIIGMLARFNLWKLSLIYVFAALLLSSTVHPWYVLWLLAFIPFNFNLAAWLFTLTISWSYVTHIKSVGYTVPTPILLAEYIPVYLLVCISTINFFFTRYKAPKYPTPPSN